MQGLSQKRSWHSTRRSRRVEADHTGGKVRDRDGEVGQEEVNQGEVEAGDEDLGAGELKVEAIEDREGREAGQEESRGLGASLPKESQEVSRRRSLLEDPSLNHLQIKRILSTVPILTSMSLKVNRRMILRWKKGKRIKISNLILLVILNRDHLLNRLKVVPKVKIDPFLAKDHGLIDLDLENVQGQRDVQDPVVQGQGDDQDLEVVVQDLGVAQDHILVAEKEVGGQTF